MGRSTRKRPRPTSFHGLPFQRVAPLQLEPAGCAGACACCLAGSYSIRWVVCLAGTVLSLFTLILMSFSADTFVALISAVLTVASSTVTAAVALQMVLSSLLLVSTLLVLKGTVATLVYDIATYDSALWLQVYRSALNLPQSLCVAASVSVC